MSKIPPTKRTAKRTITPEQSAQARGFFQGMEHYESLVKQAYAKFHGEHEVARFLEAVHKTSLAEDGSPLTPVHQLSHDADGTPRLEIVTHLPRDGESPADPTVTSEPETRSDEPGPLAASPD